MADEAGTRLHHAIIPDDIVVDGEIEGPGTLVYASPAPSDDFIGAMMLWFRDGVLCDLEYWWVTEEMPDHLPSIDQLRRH